MEELKTLEFNLKAKERNVKIDGNDYVLVELNGQDRDTYLTGVGARVKVNKQGKSAGLKTFDGLQASLIVLSLLRITEEGKRAKVPLQTIQKFPA